MGDPYYRWFPGDYLRDTGSLTLLEHGVYRMLLDHYYCEGELPSEKKRLYHLLRAKKSSEINAINFIVEKYFSIDGERLVNRRANVEILKRKEFIEKQSIKGKRSAEVKYGNRGSTAVVTVVQPDSNLSLPLPSPSLDLKDQSQKQRRVTRTKVPVRFTIPTIEEVEEYCLLRKNNVDARKFHAFYSSNGWRVGKNPMKKWKAAVVTWECR